MVSLVPCLSDTGAQASQRVYDMAIRKCQGLLLLLLGVVLLAACATVEAPEQPEAITLGRAPPMAAAVPIFVAQIAQLYRW